MGPGLDGATLFRAGRPEEAVEAVSAELRADPANLRSRTFLFELLCFLGDYDRAEKHLDIIARSSSDAEMGAWMYRTALHAERTRQEMFDADAFPTASPEPRPPSGVLNGTAFETLTDADPRIGARLELFAAGQYTWIPFEQIESVAADPPARIRDLLWIPARVKVGADFTGMELGEVILPALAPGSHRHPDPQVGLGRMTDWVETEGVEGGIPVGQKLLIVDGAEFPLLELRELRIDAPSASKS
ncbi:MAG TPA: type VI secretion system accessory protein TagJ [Longimicrobiales bacterium]|nr:type VI secretion system accessory protein TagJ [Longimicrobiales bacterium]